MSKVEKSKEASNLAVKLDQKTSVFFSHLVRDGLADFKEDPSLNEGDIVAKLEKREDGKRIVVSAQRAIAFCIAEE